MAAIDGKILNSSNHKKYTYQSVKLNFTINKQVIINSKRSSRLRAVLNFYKYLWKYKFTGGSHCNWLMPTQQLNSSKRKATHHKNLLCSDNQDGRGRVVEQVKLKCIFHIEINHYNLNQLTRNINYKMLNLLHVCKAA